LFLLVFIIVNFGKKGWWWCLGVALTAAISDIISSQIIKELFFRTRPCRDEEVMHHIRFFVNYCPTSSSFTSSHATTHFAQAIFIYLTLRHTSKWWLLILLWAFSIGYTQVYVGVHYPVDILGGALIGICIGWMVSHAFRKQFGILRLDKQ
jgi:undecaprenyl-diphosphatase